LISLDFEDDFLQYSLSENIRKNIRSLKNGNHVPGNLVVYPNNGHKEKLEQKQLTRNIKTYLKTILSKTKKININLS